MNKEENMEIRTLETFVKGVKEEGASEPCKYVQFNRQEAQRLLDYIIELQYRIDKAIEILEKRIKDNEEIDYVDMSGKSYINYQKEIIDILRGEIDENNSYN